jgi:hypothetical protein
MPRTTEQLLEEILRLARGMDHWRTWCISDFKRCAGAQAVVPYAEYASPGELLCSLVPDGAEELEKIYDLNPELDTSAYWSAKIDPTAVQLPTAKFVLKEIKQWYSHTASDLRFLQTKLNPDEAQKYTDYSKRFRCEVGFDLYAEAGLVEKTAKKVLKRGKIVSQEEWYMLKEVRDALSQTFVNGQELIKISNLMNKFEDAL